MRHGPSISEAIAPGERLSAERAEPRRGFVAAVLAELGRSFDLRGRTARAPYLAFLLTSVALFALILALCVQLLPTATVAKAVYLTTALFYITVTSAGVRRLHEVGLSGTHMLEPLKPTFAFLTVVVLLWLFGGNTGVNVIIWISILLFAKPLVAVSCVIALIGIAMTLMYFSNTMGQLLLPSQPGPNRYGPNPHEVPQ